MIDSLTNNTSLIVAGSETSATLLSGCIYYLCTTPHVMARLTREIRLAFTQDSDMTFRALKDLKYLAAVIEESLRIYPPFVTSLARTVPTGGALVNGQFVPEGVRIKFQQIMPAGCQY
jgi:cytochrome P450